MERNDFDDEIYDRRPKRNKRKEKRAERATMARTISNTDCTTDIMMVDSGTKSHMTSRSNCVFDQVECSVQIHLADDYTVPATHQRVRTGIWKGE